MTDPKKSSPGASRQGVNSYDLVVYDGRDAVGFIRKLGNVYAAYGSSGEFLGRFADQRAAMAAIPTRPRRTASS
jgi:hypothetical protein